MMLQQPTPDDYVISTGVGLTVEQFVIASFEHVGLDWQKFVRYDETYLRPSEVDSLIGDSDQARRVLGWSPTVMPLDLARIMTDLDVAHLKGLAVDKPTGSLWANAVLSEI